MSPQQEFQIAVCVVTILMQVSWIVTTLVDMFSERRERERIRRILDRTDARKDIR